MNDAIQEAAQRLVRGEVVGLPTETVYGLAADAGNAVAVGRIFELKRRPHNHPLIVHIAADADVRWWVDSARMSDEMWRLTQVLCAAFWPGPLTLVLPKHPNVDAAVTGGHDTIALRSPNHADFQDVLLHLARLKHTDQVGIAAPSANLFGRVSPTCAQHVRDGFGDGVWVLDGDVAHIGIESTIVDLTTGVPRVLRLGHVLPADIERVTGVAVRVPMQQANVPKVSGALAAHYAPATPLVWLSHTAITAADAVLVWQENAVRAARLGHCIETLPDEAQGYARGLYRALRVLDACGAARIVVQDIPDDAAWAAVRDRLGRAVVGSNLPLHHQPQKDAHE